MDMRLNTTDSKTGHFVMPHLMRDSLRWSVVGMAAGLLLGMAAGAIRGGMTAVLVFALIGAVCGGAIAVQGLFFKRAVLAAGLRPLLWRALEGALLGLILGPLTYWIGWADQLLPTTVIAVVILAVCAALNAALDTVTKKLTDA